MWWAGTVTNLPNYTAINYKIGVWNSANDEEKFADYNAGTPDTVFSFSIGQTGGTRRSRAHRERRERRLHHRTSVRG